MTITERLRGGGWTLNTLLVVRLEAADAIDFMQSMNEKADQQIIAMRSERDTADRSTAAIRAELAAKEAALQRIATGTFTGPPANRPAEIAEFAAAALKWTGQYSYDKTDDHTRLFCAASDWMDRAERAKAAAAALRALLREASAARWECSSAGDCPDCGSDEGAPHDDGCLLGRIDAAIDADKEGR